MLTGWVARLTTMERTLCIEKIKRRVGYRPRFSNREVWVKTLEWAVPEWGMEREGRLLEGMGIEACVREL
jgi:sterol-4alpha-carboxylate 3-dehydrogenase (decarboxylating)